MSQGSQTSCSLTLPLTHPVEQAATQDAAKPLTVGKHPCPECGGNLEWNPARQSLACPYCGTVVPWSPAQAADPGTEDRRAGPRGGAAATRLAAVAGATTGGRSSARVAMRSRSSSTGASRSAATSAARLRSSRTRSIATPSRRRACCRSSSATARSASASASGTAPAGSRRTDSSPPRSRIPCTASTCLTGRSTRRSSAQWQRRCRLLLLRDRNASRRQRPDAGAPGAACALGAGRRAASSTSSTTRWCPERRAFIRRCCARVEPFPTVTDLRPYSPEFVRGWTVERYQVDLHQAQAINQQDMQEHGPGTVRAAGAGRHPAQSPGRGTRIEAGPSSTSWCRSGW